MQNLVIFQNILNNDSGYAHSNKPLFESLMNESQQQNKFDKEIFVTH
jgi:hypothetical protein